MRLKIVTREEKLSEQDREHCVTMTLLGTSIPPKGVTPAVPSIGGWNLKGARCLALNHC
jgi:hypothetical protein